MTVWTLVKIWFFLFHLNNWEGGNRPSIFSSALQTINFTTRNIPWGTIFFTEHQPPTNVLEHNHFLHSWIYGLVSYRVDASLLPNLCGVIPTIFIDLPIIIMLLKLSRLINVAIQVYLPQSSTFSLCWKRRLSLLNHPLTPTHVGRAYEIIIILLSIIIIELTNLLMMRWENHVNYVLSWVLISTLGNLLNWYVLSQPITC